jgi:uncharacterized protein YndB with AHSA1/START domain
MSGSTIRYESRTVVRRPVDEVFDRLADIDHYRDWMHRTGLFRRSRLTSAAPARAGSTYTDWTRMGTYQGSVTEFVPSTRLGFSEAFTIFGKRLSVARPSYVLEVDGDSTIVHQVAVGELYGPMRLMKPMAVLMARWERGRTVRSLQRSLETTRQASVTAP